jgi:polar amino acid transport system substrate-binding protein
MSRSLRLATLGAVLGLVSAAAPVGPSDDHATAQAALTDLKAAVGAIIAVEDSYDTDPGSYREAAQRIVNMLVGERASQFDAAAGRPEDAIGAIGRLDALLDRSSAPPWAPALRTAEVNERAAVGRLEAAREAHELMDFQIAASQALNNLEVALGRPNDAGVFGGLQGALATTELGVPENAHRVDACATPVPGWGVRDGHLGFVALAPGAAPGDLADPLGVEEIAMQGDTLVLRTAAWPEVAQLCSSRAGSAGHAAASASAGQDAAARPQGNAAASAQPVATGAEAASSPTEGKSVPSPVQPTPPGAAPSSPPAGSGSTATPTAEPTLYTHAQAEAGEKVYAANCVSCHGPDLHGRAAPAIAGTDFLTAARDNEWTLQQIRVIVTSLMPLNAGGSLSPEQYADVISYLLASNCFPAGAKPFPQQDRPDLADVKFAPTAKPIPGQNALGVCPLKVSSH